MNLMLEAMDRSRRDGAQPESADPFNPTPPRGPMPDHPAASTRRRPWIALGAGATALLAVGVAAGLVYTSSSLPPVAMPDAPVAANMAPVPAMPMGVSTPVAVAAEEAPASALANRPLVTASVSDSPSPGEQRPSAPMRTAATASPGSKQALGSRSAHTHVHPPITTPPETRVAQAVAASPTSPTAASVPSAPHSQAPANLRLDKIVGQDAVTAAWQALASGHLDEAESLYRRALQAQPRNQEATLGLASVLHRQGHREGAWNAYREVLAQSPDNAIAVTGMMALLSESDPASAESRLKEFIDARPGEEGPQVALGHLMARQKRWGEAQAAFFAAYTLQPRSASNNYNLAVALDQLHQYGQALKFYRAALEGTGVQNIPVDAARQRIDTLSARGADKP